MYEMAEPLPPFSRKKMLAMLTFFLYFFVNIMSLRGWAIYLDDSVPLLSAYLHSSPCWIHVQFSAHPRDDFGPNIHKALTHADTKVHSIERENYFRKHFARLTFTDHFNSPTTKISLDTSLHILWEVQYFILERILYMPLEFDQFPYMLLKIGFFLICH